VGEWQPTLEGLAVNSALAELGELTDIFDYEVATSVGEGASGCGS
jgi:hypothetical protein